MLTVHNKPATCANLQFIAKRNSKPFLISKSGNIAKTDKLTLSPLQDCQRLLAALAFQCQRHSWRS